MFKLSVLLRLIHFILEFFEVLLRRDKKQHTHKYIGCHVEKSQMHFKICNEILLFLI